MFYLMSCCISLSCIWLMKYHTHFRQKQNNNNLNLLKLCFRVHILIWSHKWMLRTKVRDHNHFQMNMFSLTNTPKQKVDGDNREFGWRWNSCWQREGQPWIKGVSDNHTKLTDCSSTYVLLAPNCSSRLTSV